MIRPPSPAEGRATESYLPLKRLLATILPLLPCRLQLLVALRVDLLAPPRQHVLRRDVTRGAVQADVVVVVHVSDHQAPRIIERQGRSWPDALPFERFVPTLDLPVRLRVKRRSSDMRSCLRSE